MISRRAKAMVKRLRREGKNDLRGFFGVGCEGISKAMNMGAIFRTAHAFGGGFVFTVGAAYDKTLGRASDTSAAHRNLPFYAFPDASRMILPQGCGLIGVELTEDAVDLPSFHHPSQAAYVFGPERGSLSPEMQSRCDHMLKIPTAFCINVSLAAGIVVYDRCRQLGRFAPKPVWAGAPASELPEHARGDQRFRADDAKRGKLREYRQNAPDYFAAEAETRTRFRD